MVSVLSCSGQSMRKINVDNGVPRPVYKQNVMTKELAKMSFVSSHNL